MCYYIYTNKKGVFIWGATCPPVIYKQKIELLAMASLAGVSPEPIYDTVFQDVFALNVFGLFRCKNMIALCI